MPDVSIDELFDIKRSQYDRINDLIKYLNSPGGSYEVVITADLPPEDILKFATRGSYSLWRDLRAFDGYADMQSNVYYGFSEEMNDYGR